MFDVTILGLGPVGCTAALFLAEAGLKVAAVERDSDVYQLPRAVNLDGEIIRAFQRIGRADTVAGLMQTLRQGDRAGFANARRQWLFGQRMVSFGANGWQPNNFFDQPEFEGYLRNEVLSHPNVTTFIGYEAVSLSSSQDSASLTVVSNSTNSTSTNNTSTNNTSTNRRSTSATSATSENKTVDAHYLIACDGAASFTRKSLGIESTNLGYDADWLVVDVIVNDRHTLNNDTVQVCDPDRIQTYVCTRDPNRRWEFKLLPGETAAEMQSPDRVKALIDPWTPPDSYTVRRTAVYQFHASLANEWRRDNIFIAGDAAHQTPPFLGQGMNTGMRDAINLTWKLPLVLKGIAPDSLLNSYQAERFGHAHDLIDWAVSIGKLMDHMTEQFRCERDGEPPPPDPDLQTSGYGQGREQPPIRDGIVYKRQLSVSNTNSAGKGPTGQLLRQPIVRTRDGHEYRLDDLLGTGFAIVSKAPQKLSATSTRIIKLLEARQVLLGDLKIVKGHFDQLFEFADAAIIRPDRLVYGHTDQTTTIDDLIEELGRQIGFTDAVYRPMSQTN